MEKKGNLKINMKAYWIMIISAALAILLSIILPEQNWLKYIPFAISLICGTWLLIAIGKRCKAEIKELFKQLK